jgi:nucleoside phosphorylase
VLPNGAIIAEMAHIRAVSPGGARYDPSQSSDERNGFENLLILCPSHHALIDSDPVTYSISKLSDIKTRHEAGVLLALDHRANPALELDATTTVQLARQVNPAVADFAIVTALPLELAAVLAHFPTLEKVTVGDGARTYYQGIVVGHDGATRYRVVVTLLRGMGNIEAAIATSEILHVWHPRYLVMCGIAGGLRKSQQALGDVVVATSVFYYELAKLNDSRVGARPISYPADPLLLDRAMHMHRGSLWRSRLPGRPDRSLPGSSIPAVHFGPIASGEKVIASRAEAERLLDLHGGIIAVEMESGGVAASAFAAADRVGLLVVRSLCDFADQEKRDSWQDYAAHAAASFLQELLASRPIAPAGGSWAPTFSTFSSPGDIADPKWVRTVFFPMLTESVDMEELQDLCYLLHVDIDDLQGTTKRGKIRELLERGERQGHLPEIIAAFQRLARLDR